MLDLAVHWTARPANRVYWPDTGQVVSIFEFRSIAPIDSCPNGCKFGLTHFDAAGFSTTM
ncbi:hypothetical protein BG60_33690 [Caballeronia zhejiangensis]|uniref:Uncharacterized protein n=1 Tax=Caballeronia zhejiangensis TaxID=871203 RepID=A0A656QD06_9BURK|nr:hypothetical protein BG60_33690 [Caballeronia zhejiangensis]